MRHADCLAHLRRPGHADAAILDFLRAMSSTLHHTDPTCEALDAAIEAIEQHHIDAMAAQEWADDDKACRAQQRAELDQYTPRSTGAVPAFIATAI
jgi:hypothetical protein